MNYEQSTTNTELTPMNPTSLLLRAYFELLYERLEANRALLTERIEKVLAEEVERRDFPNFDRDKYAAYRDACLAFVDERLEAYNPVGIQYTFDNVRSREVLELELQLNWYDSRAEYAALVQAAGERVQAGVTDEALQSFADELIKQHGAFPDASIISAYEAAPALKKLPDYVLSRAIEQIVR